MPLKSKGTGRRRAKGSTVTRNLGKTELEKKRESWMTESMNTVPKSPVPRSRLKDDAAKRKRRNDKVNTVIRRREADPFGDMANTYGFGPIKPPKKKGKQK